MTLTPEKGLLNELSQDALRTQNVRQPSCSYRIDWKQGRIQGKIDGLDAMRQVIEKILRTERFAYEIYSWNYGAELSRVWGKSEPVVRSELERLVREALLTDDRITDIRDFELTFPNRRTAAVSFTAVTDLGNIPFETEVKRYV